MEYCLFSLFLDWLWCATRLSAVTGSVAQMNNKLHSRLTQTSSKSSWISQTDSTGPWSHHWQQQQNNKRQLYQYKNIRTLTATENVTNDNKNSCHITVNDLCMTRWPATRSDKGHSGHETAWNCRHWLQCSTLPRRTLSHPWSHLRQFSSVSRHNLHTYTQQLSHSTTDQ